ncbi:MAG TPA: tetratricopeptide repeat protein [Polyangiaceae bacterium]|nr:tetratricopeptide repeat protein [Polyangiaceae bacterium]
MMRWVLAAMLLALSVLSAGAAAADRGATGARVTEARRQFDDAVERLKAGRFAEARDLLNQSLALAPNPATAFNLGVAYRGTGETQQAVEVLSSLLSGEYGHINSERRAEVSALLAAVTAEVGTLTIETRGAAVADVRVDGRSVGASRAAGRVVAKVDPGERLVTVSADDRIPVERRVRVAMGARLTLSFELEPTPQARVGTIAVDSPDEGAELEIVGVARGRGRLERSVRPGTYRVRLRGPGVKREATVVVRARSTVRYRFGETSKTIWQSPVFWAAAASVTAAATVGAVLLLRPGQEDPVRDPEFGVVQALGR